MPTDPPDDRNIGRQLGLSESDPAYVDVPAFITCPKCGVRSRVVCLKVGPVDGVMRTSSELTTRKCGHKFQWTEVMS